MREDPAHGGWYTWNNKSQRRGFTTCINGLCSWVKDTHRAFIFWYALSSTIVGPLSNLHVVYLTPANNSELLLTKLYTLCRLPWAQRAAWLGRSLGLTLPGLFTWWACLSVLHSSQVWRLFSPLHSPIMVGLSLPPLSQSQAHKIPKINLCQPSYWLMAFLFTNQNQLEWFPEAMCRLM